MSIGPNGAAVVDPDKCTDCMACAKACPRHLITEVPVSKKVRVACANQDKGKAAMSVCSHSCIGCGLCEKECKKDAIHVVNGVAVIDYDKCVGCKLCTKVCPRDAIEPIATAEEKEKYKAIKKAQAEKAAAAKAAETAGCSLSDGWLSRKGHPGPSGPGVFSLVGDEPDGRIPDHARAGCPAPWKSQVFSTFRKF